MDARQAAGSGQAGSKRTRRPGYFIGRTDAHVSGVESTQHSVRSAAVATAPAPPGVLRLLVGAEGRIEGIDALGPVVAVPQLGELLVAGYHDDDLPAVLAHLDRVLAHVGCVAHWDARVRHHTGHVWVYEYAVSRGSGGLDVVRVYAGAASVEMAESLRALPHDALPNPLGQGFLIADGDPHAVLRVSFNGLFSGGAAVGAGFASILEDLLGAWGGVVDDWYHTAAGEYFALLQHCSPHQAERLAAQLREQLVRALVGAPAGTAGVLVMTVAEYRASLERPVALAAGMAPLSLLSSEARGCGLLESLQRHDLLLYAQPITTLSPDEAGRTVGVEFLLRVRNAEGLPETPGQRLSETERSGGMIDIDRWVVAQAFALLARYPAGLASLDFVTINISGPSLAESGLLAHILGQLLVNGIPAHKICFEITETGGIASLAEASLLMEALQRRGCRFALDDFGSGLASFAYLRSLPVDIVKLDGRFVRDPVRHLGILKHLQTLGASLGKRIVAEHVETPAALEVVRQLGVDFAQGFLLGAPECPSTLFPRLALAHRER
jgi:EAL domain-containing protein (putative c-di-GMP-specific phosphodiesterase class I)